MTVVLYVLGWMLMTDLGRRMRPDHPRWMAILAGALWPLVVLRSVGDVMFDPTERLAFRARWWLD